MVAVYAKHSKHIDKRRANDKRTYRKRAMFKCVSKNFQPKEFVREKLNEHGAKDDHREIVECVELTFSYQNHANRREDTPRILHAHYTFCTTDIAVAQQYTIGQEYKELPK